MNKKHTFFLQSCLRRLFRPGSMQCPSCGGRPATVLDRKHLVLTLARCSRCDLLYRQPTTPPEKSREFYQDDYTQGYTTDMPDDAALQELTTRKFSGTERDYRRFIAMFDALGVPRGSRVLEFGCSWGYGAWQLAQAGYKVQAFEVSRPRCRYAREKLQVDAVDALESIEGKFDLIFSSHVLEHVDVLGRSLDFLEERLRGGGLKVHVTPNGSAAYRETAPHNWHLLWGEVHPQLLDEKFCLRRYRDRAILLGSTPSDVDVLREWDRKQTKVLPLGDQELFFAVGGEELGRRREAYGRQTV